MNRALLAQPRCSGLLRTLAPIDVSGNALAGSRWPRASVETFLLAEERTDMAGFEDG